MSEILPSALGFSSVRYLEVDASTFVAPESANSFGALFYSQDGPVNDIIALASEDTLVSLYGEPDDTNAVEFWNIANAFQYKAGGINGTAKILRVVGDGSLNGTIGVTTTALVNATDLTTQRIDNEDGAINATVVFDTHTSGNGGDDTVTKLKFFSKYPTAKARKVALANSTDFPTALIKTGVSFANVFDETPGTNELAIVVLDEDDNIIDSEKFIVSLDSNSVDGFGQPNYIETLNQKSQYILVYENTGVVGVPFSFQATAFTKGAVVAPLTADYQTALSLYEDVESVDIFYMVGNNKIIDDQITLCENRLNTQLVWSANLSDVVGLTPTTAVSNLKTYTGTTLNRNTTYAEFFGNAALQYDKYAKKNRWVELAGDVVGLRILKNLTGAQWEASAGLNNGIIRGKIKLAYNVTPELGIELGRNKINPIISKIGKGIVVWGVQNYTSKKSSLSDSTVRGLASFIWRAMKSFLEFKLFEINDEITRGDIKARTDQFMDSVLASRGVYEYLTVCDSTNNTPQLIDNGQLLVEIRYKPTRIAKEIILLAKLGSSGVDLEVI